MWKTTLTLALKLQIIFNILGKGQPEFLLIALEVMNQGCLQRPTQAHIPEDLRDGGLVSRLLGAARVAFPEMLPLAHEAGMNPWGAQSWMSLPLPTPLRESCKTAMELALVLRPALIINPPLPSFTCQTTALSKYQHAESGPCTVWFAQDHTGSLWPSWKLSPRLPAPGLGLGCPSQDPSPCGKMGWTSSPQGDGLDKSTLPAHIRAQPGVGMPLQQVLSGIYAPQVSAPGTWPHEKVRKNPALQWRLLIYIFSASLSVLLMLLTSRGIFEPCWGADVEHRGAGGRAAPQV